MGIASIFFKDYQNAWGAIFLIVLGLNLMVLTFEFPRATWLTLTFAIIAVIVSLFLINQYLEIIKPLKDWVARWEIYASRDFYFAFLIVYCLMFVAMYAVTRFDYWELGPNELVHHHGILGDTERFSTAGLKFNKEVADIFEYILCGAGRVVMQLPGNPRPIVLDNVLTINRIGRLADKMLEARMVVVQHQEGVAVQEHDET